MTVYLDGQAVDTLGGRIARATLTFDGTANKGQTGTAATLFTVTGRVELISLVVFCTASLTLSGVPTDGSCALGVTGSTSFFIAAVNSLDIDVNEFWFDAAPTLNGMAIIAAHKNVAFHGDVLLTNAGTDNTNGGTLEFYVRWRPLSADGNVIAA